jgi:N-methylhydantoinase A
VPSGPITEETLGELIGRFHVEYERRFGQRFEYLPVQGVTYRVQLIVPAEKVNYPAAPEADDAGSAPAPVETVELRHLEHEPIATPVYERTALRRGQRFDGPAIVRESLATTFLLPGQRAEIGPLGEIIIATVAASERSAA